MTSIAGIMNSALKLHSLKLETKEQIFMFRTSPKLTKLRNYALSASIVVLTLQQNAYAAGSGMPWEGPLEQILNSLAGPVARAIGVAAIIVTGLGIAFGEGGGGMRKMLWVVFGLTIAFSATSFFLSFFGGASGATI